MKRESVTYPSGEDVVNLCSHCGGRVDWFQLQCPNCGRDQRTDEHEAEPSVLDRIGRGISSLVIVGIGILVFFFLVTNWHGVSDGIRQGLPFVGDPVCSRVIGFNNDAIDRVNVWFADMDDRGQYRSWTNRDWEESIASGNEILTWLETMSIPRDAESIHEEIRNVVDYEIEILYAVWYGDQSTYDRYVSRSDKADARLNRLQDDFSAKCNSKSTGSRQGE